MPILAAAAVVAVAITLVLLRAPAGPHGGGASATQKTGPGTAGAAGSAHSLALPTVAGTIQVGQFPSFIQVAPNGKFAYITNVGAKAITVLEHRH